MNNIHPTAIIEKGAEIDESVTIGPYSIIGPNVRISSNTRIEHYCNITGFSSIGKNNIFYPYTSIGTPPQDIAYKGETTKLTIGDNNAFREFVTINTGTLKDKGETIIGNNNYLMAYAHIGHDCVIGNNIIMANAVQLGGHVRVGDYVGMGGLAGVHHLVTIGEHSYIAGAAKVIQDVPPFIIVEGHPAKVRAVNVIGLERRGFPEAVIGEIEKAYRLIWRSKLTASEAFEQILSSDPKPCKEVLRLIEFLENIHKGRFGRYLESQRKVSAR
ncbi:MAG: acyl-ACP--UDP-N-acetylglucosamine O-acyltransferase [Planctomycetota bacterium]|nr:acyl-ACP--UDP-N-acetylglucosamine O-acyltransferase [Planctomycetota bacterium]